MNRPDPRRWRDVLLGAGLLLGVAACTWQGIKPDGVSARRLYISGDAAHVSDDRIASIAAPYLGAPFYDIDIAALQADLHALPWLSDVSVSRHWPNVVVVDVAEHQPVALWGTQGVLCAEGRVFTPESDTRPTGLVRLDGPSTAGLEVYQRYQRLAQILAGHDVRLAQLALDARGSWMATLGNGLKLRLGRDGIGGRMQRFVRYGLGNDKARRALLDAGYVDLRYSDGFAVGGSRSAEDTGSDKEKVDEQAA